MKKLTLTLVSAVVLTSFGWSDTNAEEARFLDVIVKLDVDTANTAGAHGREIAAEVAAQHGIQTRHVYGTVFSGFSARIPEARFEQLQQDPMVAHIDFDAPVHIAGGNCPSCGGGGGGGDTGQTVPWGIDRIGSQTNSNTGAGIDIYIIDTGIDPNHRDLNVVGGFAVENCRGGGCAASWDDDNDHGTHVAGTAAALDNDVDVVGVAPGANLYAVKVLSGSGSGSRSGVIAGIDWVTQQALANGNAAVANMSLGGSGSKTGSCSNSGFTGTDTYHEAICNSRNAGVVYAVAAGNSGADAAGSVPSAFDDTVITVSATSSGDDWPSWSNWGNDAAAWTSNNSAPVGIAAPGVSVLSTLAGGGTTTFSGTSMASPHVAGALALFLASSAQSSNGTAFENARAALLSQAEGTGTFSNTSGNPHDEDSLDASGL
ncbi:MAG: S8 family serine peptidase [Wenzhouxiangellaceae bacterium]